jgi:hypothetical protein
MRGVEARYQRKSAVKNLFLTTLMLGAAVFAVPASAVDKLPPGTARNIVLVPGALADESSWDNVSAILKAKGYRVAPLNSRLPLADLRWCT